LQVAGLQVWEAKELFAQFPGNFAAICVTVAGKGVTVSGFANATANKQVICTTVGRFAEESASVVNAGVIRPTRSSSKHAQAGSNWL
jgi:hypothetical protein